MVHGFDSLVSLDNNVLDAVPHDDHCLTIYPVQCCCLVQGLERLVEAGRPMALPSLPFFVTWVVEDLVREEADTIAESELPLGEVRRAASRSTAAWFKGHVAGMQQQQPGLRNRPMMGLTDDGTGEVQAALYVVGGIASTTSAATAVKEKYA